ncbi:MAG: ATP-dependent metalloprotease FtsH, partial [Pseudomonadota bacterium]
MNNFGKNLALWIIIGLLLVALFNLFQTSSNRVSQTGQQIPYSQLLDEVDRGSVSDVTIKGNQISGHYSNGA